MTFDTKHLRALANAASPGPWTPAHGSRRWVDIHVPQEDVAANHDADAAFVAAARTAVPELIDEVERLTRERAEIISDLVVADRQVRDLEQRLAERERISAIQGEQLAHYALESGFAKGRLDIVRRARDEACDRLRGIMDADNRWNIYRGDEQRLRAVGVEP